MAELARANESKLPLASLSNAAVRALVASVKEVDTTYFSLVGLGEDFNGIVMQHMTALDLKQAGLSLDTCCKVLLAVFMREH